MHYDIEISTIQELKFEKQFSSTATADIFKSFNEFII